MAHERIPWARGNTLARRLVEILTPHCARIAIAGSLRRQNPFVGDVDLVILAHQRSAVLLELEKIATVINGDGTQADPQNVIIELKVGGLTGFQVDVFFARPDARELLGEVPGNWGSLLLCRTGSTRHNIALVEHAKRKGLRWQPYEGVMKDGSVIVSRTEEEIYAALGTPFLEPTDREAPRF